MLRDVAVTARRYCTARAGCISPVYDGNWVCDQWAVYFVLPLS
jgi:hypothetical protein